MYMGYNNNNWKSRQDEILDGKIKELYHVHRLNWIGLAYCYLRTFWDF